MNVAIEFLRHFLSVYIMQLEYFETILNPYFTPDAREALKSLQGVLLNKATESGTENLENPGHNRRATRGSEDAVPDDKPPGMTVSPDDLIVRSLLLLRFLIVQSLRSNSNLNKLTLVKISYHTKL